MVIGTKIRIDEEAISIAGIAFVPEEGTYFDT